MFVNIEDETGLINVIVSKGCQTRFRRTALMSPALLVRGRLERHDGAVNVIAEHLAPLALPAAPPQPGLPLAGAALDHRWRLRSGLTGCGAQGG